MQTNDTKANREDFPASFSGTIQQNNIWHQSPNCSRGTTSSSSTHSTQCHLCCSVVCYGCLHLCCQPGCGWSKGAGVQLCFLMFPFLVLVTWSQGAVFRCQQCSRALRSNEIRGGGYGPRVPLPVFALSAFRERMLKSECTVWHNGFLSAVQQSQSCCVANSSTVKILL